MQVALFVTCLTDSFFPRAGEAVVRVLRHFGCDVAFPEEQTCCGQPAFNSGFHDEAATLARRTIAVFRPYEQIVCPSASCTNMICQHYVELLRDDAEWLPAAESLAERAFEFVTFLRQRLNIDVAQLLHFDEPVTFHYPCHARGIYDAHDLRTWLAHNNDNFRAPAHDDLCCGFGGLFAVEQKQISGAMVRDKLADLKASGAQLVVCNEGGCTLQIAGAARKAGLPLRFRHIAECLAESLGLMEAEV